MIEPKEVERAPDTMMPHMRDKDLFTIEIGSFYKYLIIAITDTTGLSIFYEDNKDVVCYRYDMIYGSETRPISCSLEDLLDEVGRQRPKCFEWFLFHPEWL